MKTPDRKLSHDDHYKGSVLGFLFSEDFESLLVIKRGRLEKLNCIEGKIKPGESHRAAMWREFREESGTNYDDWQYLNPYEIKPNLFIHVFYGTHDLSKCKTLTDEELIIIKTSELSSYNLVDGIEALVEQCLKNIQHLTPVIQ